mmetsp:Transcript_1932/g.2419  ORF Transcript_1932/g.2419 Transcript_1932/m.2419 type:complete len:81 (+) Transcript_1932:89-331(+)
MAKTRCRSHPAMTSRLEVEMKKHKHPQAQCNLQQGGILKDLGEAGSPSPRQQPTAVATTPPPHLHDKGRRAVPTGTPRDP